MRRVWIPIVFLALGAATGGVVARVTGAPSKGAPVEERAPPANSAPVPSSAVPTEVSSSTADTANTPDDNAPDESAAAEGDLDGVARRIVDDAMTAAARSTAPCAEIEGTIVDSTGQPFADVPVTLRALRVERGRSAEPRSDDIEAEVQGMLEGALWSDARTLRGVSDQNGRVVFSNVASDARYTVRGYDGPYDFAPEHLEVRPGEPFQLFAYPMAMVEFVVRGPDGQRLEGADIQIQTARYQTGLNYGPGRTSMRLRSGTFVMHAETKDPAARSAKRVVTIDPGVESQTVELDVTPRAGIRGTIERLPGEDGGMFRVFWRKAGDLDPDDPHFWRGATEVMTSSWQGEFEILDLAPGSYCIGATRREMTPDVTARVEVGSGIAEVTLRYAPIPAGEMIAVRVFEAGAPVTGRVEFDLAWRTNDDSTCTSFPSLPQRDGTFALLLKDHVLRELAEPGREFAVIVKLPYFGFREIPIGLPPPAEIRAEFGAAATCELEVVSAGGPWNPTQVLVEVVPTRARWSEGRRRSWGILRIQSQVPGGCSLGQLEAGEYSLRLTRGFGDDSPVFATQTVRLAPGDNTARITLPALYRVMVRVTAVGRVWGGLESGSVTWGSDSLENGCAVFTVPAGHYTFSCRSASGGRGSREIDVAGDLETTCDLVYATTIDVKVTDPNGFLGRVGLETGDLITAVDGAVIEDIEDALGRIQALSFESVRVLRNGAEHELRVPSGEEAPGHLGGSVWRHED